MKRWAWLGVLGALAAPWAAAANPESDADFLARSEREFKAFGFAVDARAINFDLPGAARAQLLAAARPGSASVFSSVSPGPAKARCVVGWRPSFWASSPERLLEAAGVHNGGSSKALWRVMIRHEFGHCALAAMAMDPAPRQGAPAEGFADAFALAWSADAGEPPKDLAAYVQGRNLSGAGAGPGAVERALSRGGWGKNASACAKAWTAFPWPGDSRDARRACPAR
jgi:hypothetical protein